MSFTESDRMHGVSGSIIRELFKMTASPDMISFAGGNPSPDTFPMDEIAAIANDALLHRGTSMLQYGFTEGFPPLRETLKSYYQKKHGFPTENDDLITCSGGQQAADLTAKVLLNEGDVALCEELSFVGVLNTFRAYGAKLVGVRMEPDGMNIEDLEAKIKANPRAKLIYIIPNFQNPTGFTTSEAKRKAIYALAQRYDLMILEDDPYGELRYEGEFLTPIKSMDTDGRVIYGGSFSKTMAPALRVGFIVAEKNLMKRLIVAKQTGDVHTATLTQEICYRYMAEHDFEGHLRDIRRIYAVKCKRMLDDMEQKFSPVITFNRPQGGLFVTAFLPEGMDAWSFVQEGIARKVATVPGVAFVMDQSVPSNAFRMNFSMPSLEQIDQGTDILGKLTYEWCK